jgi:hypothetical protein
MGATELDDRVNKCVVVMGIEQMRCFGVNREDKLFRNFHEKFPIE